MSECCETATKLIYACSGAADVGEIADQVARRLRSEEYGKMTCLAGIGAGLSGYVQSAKGAAENITIDGCSVSCAKKTLEKIGVRPTAYILTDLGLVKGESPVTEKTVKQISDLIKRMKGTSIPTTQMGIGGCSCGGKC